MEGILSKIDDIEKKHLKENIEIASYINFLSELKSLLSSDEIIKIDNLIAYLKKQIPLDKVERQKGDYTEYICPTCGEEVLPFGEYCNNCRQRFTFRSSTIVIDSLPSELFSEA